MLVVETAGFGRVELRGHHTLVLHARPAATVEDRDRLLQRWYRDRLRERVPPLLAKWQERLGVAAHQWGIKKMKTKWGTCNAKARRIWLNLELIKKPSACLEYVLVHELVHLLARNHDERFLGLMDRHLPTWRRRRAELNAAPLAKEAWGC
jgi:predicted metal-dependent hydrolase